MTGINVESKHGIVFKHDEDCACVIIDLNQIDNLAFDLRETVIT